MRIILLGCTPPPVGGIAKWTTRMMKADLGEGYELRLVDERMIEREVFGDNTKVNYIAEGKRWIRVWGNLIKELINKEAKVVHSCPIGTRNSMLAETVNATLSRIFGKRVILHFRCTLPNMIKTDKMKKQLIGLCEKGDLIIALNNQTNDYLADLTTTPTVVVPNFIDESELIGAEKYINDEVKTVLYTGGVTEEKGCIEIIEIAKRFPDITFRLVGKSSPEVEQCASLCSNVVLVGVKDNAGIKQELQNADVYMFLSHFPGEGFSNSLAEAMAAGLPCIVTDWAANADMIDDGKGGFVIKQGDINAGVAALGKMMLPDVRKSQSAYNFRKATEQYTQDTILERYKQLYTEVEQADS